MCGVDLWLCWLHSTDDNPIGYVRTKMKKLAITTLGLGLALSACAGERPLESYNEDVELYDDNTFTAYGNLSAQDAHVFGDIGGMRNLDNPAQVQGYDEGDYTTLEVITQDNRGAAMHWLEFYGGVTHPALQPGNELSFIGGNYPEREGAIHVEAMACQGEQVYAWDYDESATRTDVTVHEVEGRDDLIELEYVTYVPTQGTLGFNDEAISSGTFVLQR